MSRAPIVFTLLLVLAPLSGCVSEDAAPVESSSVAQSAQAAGAVNGAAPSAAKDPYQVEAGAQATTVYPVSIETNKAKSPYTNEFTGEYQPQECLPTGGGLPLGGLGLARGGKRFDVSEAFAKNDVFLYEVTLTFANTDESWAELHLWNQFDDVGNYWNEPTSDKRGEVVLNFTGQGFIVNEDMFAMIGIDCWFGQVTSPIPFKITIDITFAEGGIPAAQPVLLTVSEGATRMFATPLAIDTAKPTTSHYRVFAPDDSLVCECSLSSDETVDVLEFADGPGDYVILVDHTENGFLSLALDAPTTGSLRPLGSRFERIPLAGSDGGRVDETLQIQLNSTPLDLNGWVFAPGDTRGTPDLGGGKDFQLTVANARGDALRMKMVGYFTYHAAVPDMFATNSWYAIPMDGDWEFFQDHHAFDLGGHTVTVKAENMRGMAMLFARFYDRAS